MKSIRIITALALTMIALPAIGAQDAKKKDTAPAAAPAAHTPTTPPSPIIIQQLPSYPLTACPVCTKSLPSPAIDYVKDNRLYRLDAEACKKAVDADPAAVWKKIEAAVISQQKPKYPMKTSPVSDKELDDKAVDYVTGTRLVRLSNHEEIGTFEKDPTRALAKLDKAYIEAQLPGYTLKTCPVSNDVLGTAGEPVNYLYGTKLVRFCCKDCIATFQKDPAKYMALVK